MIRSILAAKLRSVLDRKVCYDTFKELESQCGDYLARDPAGENLAAYVLCHMAYSLAEALDRNPTVEMHQRIEHAMLSPLKAVIDSLETPDAQEQLLALTRLVAAYEKLSLK
jgi:hypothetical protein